MAFYNVNVLLALPSGKCTLPHLQDKCPRCMIIDSRGRVVLNLSKWIYPDPPRKGFPADKDFERKQEFVLGRDGKSKLEGAVCVTIEESQESPNAGDRFAFERLNEAERSRLTIFGHGNEQSTEVGGRSAEAMKNLILQCGVRRVTRISLLACYGAGNIEKSEEMVDSSFARTFHGLLAASGVYTELTARARSVRVDMDGSHKLASLAGTMVRRPKNTKYLFSWKTTPANDPQPEFGWEQEYDLLY